MKCSEQDRLHSGSSRELMDGENQQGSYESITWEQIFRYVGKYVTLR